MLLSRILQGGWKSVDKYCKAVGDSLVVRYDRITAKSAEGPFSLSPSAF